jgi:alpha-L-arabinofuranosidase
VNPTPNAQSIAINLRGVTNVYREASLEVLSGEPADVNSVAAPTKVAPKRSTISNAGTNFLHEFPANSVSVVRLKAKW